MQARPRSGTVRHAPPPGRTASAAVSLPSLSRRLIDTADAGRSVARALQRFAPWLLEQVRRDAACAGLWRLWGNSRNFDEHAQRPIVHPAILAALGDAAGIPMHAAVVHAGLMHTYGYLLSNIRTRFGFKRQRYTETHWQRGLGLGTQLLRPRPRDGTLLGNLTWVVGKLAFAADSAEATRLAQIRQLVAPQLLDLLPRPSPATLVESVGIDPSTQFDILTQVVPLRPAATRDSHLLIYSLRRVTRTTRHHQLLTAFPVATAVVQEVRELASSDAPIRLRFNAHHPALATGEHTGTRRWIDEG